MPNIVMSSRIQRIEYGPWPKNRLFIDKTDIVTNGSKLFNLAYMVLYNLTPNLPL